MGSPLTIGISAVFQHSFFSSGSGTCVFSLADALKALGHKVILCNIAGKTQWWDDVEELKSAYETRHLAEWAEKGYGKLDMFIDIDGFIVPAERRRLAEKVVVMLRKPLTISELEGVVYPVNQPVRNLLDSDAVWMWDTCTDQDVHIAELLSNKPVYKIPYTWSERPLATYTQSHPTWLTSAADPSVQAWDCHIAETNMSVTTNCTVPLVTAAYIKTHSKQPFQHVYIHNSATLEQHAFFKDNVLAHCQRPGLQISFQGRQRVADWRIHKKCWVLSHIRFLPIKPALLDCVWNGIPLVHNSPWLRDFGYGLERYYYNDNSITGATAAFDTMVADYESRSGVFAEGALDRIRSVLNQRFTPSAQAWSAALTFSPVIAAEKTVLRVGFSDFWQDYNYTYNFWTLLLEAALKGKVQLQPVAVTEANAVTEPLDVLFFGPFGNTWKTVGASVPKVHVTGESTDPVQGHGVYLNLGFAATDLSKGIYRFPLWYQYIDWFNADQERLQNPKSLPVEVLLPPTKETVLKKDKFCSFIVTNPSNPVRNTAFHWLSQYKQVDSAGRLFNNVGDVLFTNCGGGGGGELKKYEFLRSYKFSLTYENLRKPGYTTEKFFAAKAAGCIPIYWGAEDVAQDFGTEGYINANKFETPDDLISAVRDLEENHEKYMAVATKGCFDVGLLRHRLAEAAKLILAPLLSSGQLQTLPSELGRVPSTAPVLSLEPPAPERLSEPLSNFKWNGKTMLVTCSTQRFVPSLMQWLGCVVPRLKADVMMSARVYLGGDIDSFQRNLLRTEFPQVEFIGLPTTSVSAPGFPDLWEPQHFAWKLWIYQSLVQEKALANTLVWYMDCASYIVRWPVKWLGIAAEKGICMLEDAEQKNYQWCHEEFCKVLNVTETEKQSQQVVGGIMAFVVGAPLAWSTFTEAWVYGQQRRLIIGPKWSGVGPDGKPFGHRHDQSILSILRLRKTIPVEPLATVYNHESIRRCFKSGACLYIHRGQLKEHVNFAPRIGETHIISLPRRKDRIDRFKANHEGWTKDVCLRPAFDGRTLTLTPNLARLFAPNDFFWKKAVMGCALSHLSLWLELASEAPICENYLILEDDVKFRPGWLEQWKLAAEEIPEDYDVLYLGGVLPPNRGVFDSLLEPVNAYWSKVRPNQIFGQKTPTNYFHFCNYAYILSRQGAQKILQTLSEHGGYYTSADHMICNRVDILNHYVLNPLVAGCYQDDDPKYASSQFNNFSRVDGFDSDLWNNDERFTEVEVRSALEGWKGEALNLQEALVDAMKQSRPLPQPLPQQHQSRFTTVGDHRICPKAQLEYKWMLKLFGPTFEASKHTTVPLDHEPLKHNPIFVLCKPHLQDYLITFQRYEAAGIPFYAVHLSDEHCVDPIDWYEFSSCKGVVRFYNRADCIGNLKVLTIPLGPNRWPTVDPVPVDRSVPWSFYGTKWMNRESALLPWTQIEGGTSAFYTTWMDTNQLGEEDYAAICQNTHFMPCPRGQNPETFRLYEALEYGAIPVVVRESGCSTEFIKMVTTNVPVPVFDTWAEGAAFAQTLLQNPITLAEYHTMMSSKWSTWKKKLVEQCAKQLAI
jgi:GR25 family glycosyltransferase involved in LPS biosynthesis